MSYPLQLYEHLYTLYLFTATDLVTVLFPQTLFAVFMSSSSLFIQSNHPTSIATTLYRLPHIICWIWLQLLVLDVSNQRHPGSMKEDILNKPWRPIPSKRITPEAARRVLVASIIGTLVVSIYLSAGTETLVLFMLNWVYNDLEQNDHWLPRNIINAVGLTTMGIGATRIACEGVVEIDEAAFRHWCLLCGTMMLSTIHIQELYDQEGDAARGRLTAPLILGDGVARWSIVAAVLIWSVVMPLSIGMRFRENGFAYAAPLVLGTLVGLRLLMLRSVQADKTTYKIWALWTVCLYSLPFIWSVKQDFRLMT